MGLLAILLCFPVEAEVSREMLNYTVLINLSRLQCCFKVSTKTVMSPKCVCIATDMFKQIGSMLKKFSYFANCNSLKCIITNCSNFRIRNFPAKRISWLIGCQFFMMELGFKPI